MIDTIAPVWDGNETWLILGGGGMLAVFPTAYSVLLTAFYAPLIGMLLALIFRGVAFEFRFRDPGHKRYWDAAFTGGSALATFCQGIVLGAFIQGVAVEGHSYAGGWFDWLTLFSLFTGIALLLGYAILGTAWLIMKTEGDLQARLFKKLPILALAVLAAMGVVSLWTPFLNRDIFERWFSYPNLLLLSPVPLLVLVTAYGFYRAIRQRHESRPFLLALALFALSYVGLGISVYPNIVPPGITIWEAAAPPESLSFMLVGAAILLPMILGYTAYAYWVFRGKVKVSEHYH